MATEFPVLRPPGPKSLLLPSWQLKVKLAYLRWRAFRTGEGISPEDHAFALQTFTEVRHYLFIPTMYGFTALAFGADWWKVLAAFGMVFLMMFFQLAARRIEQLGAASTLAGIGWLIAGHDVVSWALQRFA